MKFLPREAWHYTALLLLLFAIAGIAVWHTMAFLDEQIPGSMSRTAAALIWSLTLGFLLIAGAFGLWAIQFSSEAESRRRIGHLVDAMHYLSDGLIAIDRRGRIRGSNPAAGILTGVAQPEALPLQKICPCLSDEDVRLLAGSSSPQELEREYLAPEGFQVLRFRSQPSEGLSLVLVSDITAMREQRQRRRQAAQMQLIGELSRAAAHDFDNLLCGIAGHAALLQRLPPGSPESMRSIEEIARNVARGTPLAAHLIHVASQTEIDVSTADVPACVTVAVRTLRETLPHNWSVDYDAPASMPAAGLTPQLIEQVVLHLGLTAAAGCAGPGIVEVRLTAAPAAIAHNAAGLIQIRVRPADNGTPDDGVLTPVEQTSGLVLSVIRSLLAGAGGGMECLASASGKNAYRITLPCGTASDLSDGRLPEQLRTYMANWRVLLAGLQTVRPHLTDYLLRQGVRATSTPDIASALSVIESTEAPDAAVLHDSILGREPAGLLRAIRKLRPGTGIVVFSADPTAIAPSIPDTVGCVSSTCTDTQLLTAIIESRGLVASKARTRFA